MAGKHPILTYLSQEPVHKHWFVLPKTINSEDTLDIIWWIPRGIKNNYSISSYQIYSKGPCFCWDNKQTASVKKKKSKAKLLFAAFRLHNYSLSKQLLSTTKDYHTDSENTKKASKVVLAYLGSFRIFLKMLLNWNIIFSSKRHHPRIQPHGGWDYVRFHSEIMVSLTFAKQEVGGAFEEKEERLEIWEWIPREPHRQAVMTGHYKACTQTLWINIQEVFLSLIKHSVKLFTSPGNPVTLSIQAATRVENT